MTTAGCAAWIDVCFDTSFKRWWQRKTSKFGWEDSWTTEEDEQDVEEIDSDEEVIVQHIWTNNCGMYLDKYLFFAGID